MLSNISCEVAVGSCDELIDRDRLSHISRQAPSLTVFVQNLNDARVSTITDHRISQPIGWLGQRSASIVALLQRGREPVSAGRPRIRAAGARQEQHLSRWRMQPARGHFGAQVSVGGLAELIS
ncbi:hypothetical protein Q0Z83_039840 [Actinoplanes sichuanensis]|nr:hypothetical protein Q0Z83_039840 [Actinoplanes sichuanensis]